MKVTATEAKNRFGRLCDWIEEQNRNFERYGLWNDDLRTW